jgi:hypothetical protein
MAEVLKAAQVAMVLREAAMVGEAAMVQTDMEPALLLLHNHDLEAMVVCRTDIPWHNLLANQRYRPRTNHIW